MRGPEAITENKVERILTFIKHYSKKEDRIQINSQVVLKVANLINVVPKTVKQQRLYVGEVGLGKGIILAGVAEKVSLRGNI